MDPYLPTRRALLRRTASGFGMIGLGSLLAAESARSGLAPKATHFPARAKRVIFLFMEGGPSHLDSFDPKPLLDRDHLKPPPFDLGLTFNGSIGGNGNLMKSPYRFKRYGQMGMPVSELFPHIAQHVDKMCFLRSMVGEGLDHGGAMLQIHTGTVNLTRPSMGSWMLYGLGTENQDLPGFVTIKPHLGHSGVRNWSSAFLPGNCQGTPIGTTQGAKIDDLKKEPIENLVSHLSPENQRYELDMLRAISQRHADANKYDDRLESRIQSFELAFRMQAEAPAAFDVEKESEETKKLYGLDSPVTRDFGWQLLLARRLSERGVRVVQCTHPGWDQHTELARRHAEQARMVDLPIAGLLKDLEARGLLESTLVIWGGEFGRTPFMERDGRDHNPHGFTYWMAGGGAKPGFVYGETDDYGYRAVVDRMHIHDFHATVLHLLGLEHERLTYRYSGRDFRLTDVAGVVAKKVIA
ncbi:DUF1501 domain-containing protein [Bryobacter aggregatus]|uniref:DUF1501 domain-containing protein n=1 Tax=Bryobacter aggregatus TaxID=360054 RepID=UPI0004E0F504|nr:DUF1501 domain-containing protein [Bryobacter aggregatus]